MDSKVESPNGVEPVVDDDAPFDIEDVIAEAAPQERSVRICVKGGLRAKFEELSERLKAASEDHDSDEPTPEMRVLAAEVETIRGEIRRSMRKFTLRSIGPNWTAIRVKHANAQDVVHDVAAYGAELFAAATVSPTMTVEQARRLVDRLNQGDMNALFATAQLANFETTVEVPKSRLASDILEASRSATS